MGFCRNLPQFSFFYIFYLFSCKNIKNLIGLVFNVRSTQTMFEIYNTRTLPIRFSSSSFQAQMLVRHVKASRKVFCMRRCRSGACRKMAIRPTHPPPTTRDFCHKVFAAQFFCMSYDALILPHKLEKRNSFVMMLWGMLMV